MFPLNDDNPISITPWINWGLIGMNIFIFLYEITQPEQQLNQFFHMYALIPQEFSTNPSGEWLTLITSQFLHGGWLHVGANMLYLWIFGNNIEDRMGHIPYLLFYITCGILAALSQWFISMGSTIPSLGASGAIAGVLGAYILRFPQAKVLTLVFIVFFATTIRIPAMYVIGIFFIQNLLSGLASINASTTMMQGGVAYWAHIGGFAFGAILAPFFGLYRRD
ncbi:MAG: rhomboid family intramembrane serine protease [Nostocaceae cyanobacterium]|nr:rhomboid family intramembrane serine protease [Nostocaceae cyanobacterium]